MDLREQKFGIEIELTGLTRKRAAEVIGKYLGQEPDISRQSLAWISFQNLSVSRDAYEELCEKAEAFGLSQDTPSYDEFVKKQE